MTEPVARPRRRWKYLLIITGALVVLLLAGLWYTTTNSFQASVRRRMIAEVERITGGRAEIGSFHVVPFHMQVEVRDITVHGTEAPTEAPLVHADHLVAQMKVISFLRTEIGFYSLTLERPVVHIAISPDGTTNVPAPKVPVRSQTPPVEQLFALSIDHLSMQNGELIWADRKIPLDFAVHDTGLQMDYSFLRGRYESRLSLGKVDTAFEDFRPFAWMTTVEFSLGTTFADVKSLKWSSGHSNLEASGRISDFNNPRLDASYDARIDLGEVAAIARRHDLREGIAEFKGSGHWALTEDQFATSGAVAFHDVGWQDDQIAFKKASLTTDYSVTDQQIKLSKLQGKLFNGSLAGEALVDNWLHSVPPPPPGKDAGKAKKGAEDLPVVTAARPPAKKGEKAKVLGVQTGAVHLRLRDVLAGEVAKALDMPAHPLGHFRPSGLATGSVDATWKGPAKDADVTFVLDMNPPPRPVAGEVPVNAHVQGVYHGGSDVLELAQFNVNTPASRVQAAGTLSASSTVHLSVATSDLEEWRPLVRVLGGPTNLPFRVDGTATFNGVAGGSFSAPTLAGTLAAQDFEFTLPATSRTSEQQVHWDALAASIQFSPHDLGLRGGTLKRGDTSADFDVSAVLQKGQFTEDSPFTARVNLHSVDVASTAALAGFDYPVSGTADVSLQVSGTRANPLAQGHIRAANASAYGESIEKFDADLHIEENETALSNIHITHQDAVIVGTAAYTPDTRSFRLDLKGENFDVSQIRQMHLENLPVEGRADFTLNGSGTLDAPVINAGLHVRDLMLDHELAGGLYFEAATKDGELRLSGHSELPHGTLFLEGNVAMRGDYPANITARVDHIDLDALWRAYLGTQLTGHSSVAGAVTMQGPLRYPKQWTLKGDASDISIELESAKLHNQGPVRFTYADQTAHIEPTHMIGEGTDVTGHGSISWGGSQDLDLAADGQIDLKLLDSLDPDLTASGQMLLHMTVGGTLNGVLPQGTIEVKNAAAAYAGLPSGVSEMNGSLTFTRDRVHIEQLTARTGGGTLDLKGDATNYNRELNFNVTAVGRDVRLRYPPGVSSTATAELRWVGTRSASIISGDILVTKLAVTPGFDFGSYLERSRQSAAITAANSPLYNVKLDIAARTAPELQMKTAVARLSGDADLRLRGSLARPSVLGRADILEGDATFNGIKFRLERGDITFANPVAIEPQVNLQATTHVRNYDLDVTVTGTPDRLNVNYRSEPPLPKSDIIALLALGRTSQESEQLQQQSGQSLFTDEATNLIINQAINATVSSRMQKLFGVSRIKIDPQGLTTETNPTARGPQVTIEEQFANNISLSYSTNVSQSSQQIIQGEYYVNRNVSVVGTRDQNGVVSFDVRIRRRKK
ncbi:MAG TPA: translocation/assembly module TamB domain-containing protein [Candidatus Sulfotelmatobacter sp.]|nr:translocation/assembly module TamB domain-containing protein [Candidatus Sulfotelmatobacter sp.]